MGFDAPIPYLDVPETEREARTRKSDDLCSIDDEHFFVRGVIELPISGQDACFGIGAWVSLSDDNFFRYVDLFDSEDPSGDGPYFGWLCNSLPGYPETFQLRTNVHLRPAPTRPYIELQPTDHPLAVHQQKGITLPEVQSIVERVIHPENAS